jgi:hypothetical protein
MLGIVLSVGGPLVGLGVFHAADMLNLYAPWRADAPHGFLPENGLVSDTVNGVMPSRAEFVRRLHSGDVALWADTPGGGGALGVIPDVALFSPLTWPYLLLPLWYAPAVAKALELAVAAAFTALFLRRLSTNRIAAAVGGLVYMNSGFQVAWTNWPQSQVGAFIPVLFWAVERAIQTRRVAALVPVALATTGLLLGGFPFVAVVALLAAGVYALVRCLCLRAVLRARAGLLAGLASGVVLGVGLAAVHLLPFVDRLSWLGLDYRTRVAGQHLPLESLVTTAVPWAFGAYVDGVYYGARNIVETLSFVGAAAVVLILVAAIGAHQLSLPRGARSALWGLLIFGVIATFLGGPLLALLEQSLPLVFENNFIGRLRSVLGFVAAVLAGLGVQVVSLSAWRLRRVDRLRVAAIAAVLAILSYEIASRVLVRAEAVHQLRYLARQSLIPVAALIIAVGLVVLARRFPARRPLALALLPGLVLIESMAVVWPFWPRIPKSDFYPVTAAHSFLLEHQGNERILLQDRALEPGSTTFYGIRTVAAHQFFQPSWKEALRRTDQAAFRRETFPMFAQQPENARQVVGSPIFDRLAAKYYAAQPWAPVLGDVQPLPKPPLTAELATGQIVERPAPPGRLRALRVWLATVYDRPARAELRAEVRSPAGEVVAIGSRRVDDVRRVGVGVIDLAFPEVDVPPGSITRLELRATGGSVRLGSDSAGIVVRAVRAADDGLRAVFADGVTVYERTTALSRFRWAARTRVVADPDQRLNVLASDLPEDAVLLDRPGSPGEGRPAAITVRTGAGDEFVVDVDARGGGYLVIADALQRDWVAEVDGHEADLVPADHALVAVHVPRGSHRVELRYQPEAWTWGRALSAASVLLLLGLAGWHPTRRFFSRSCAGEQPVASVTGAGSPPVVAPASVRPPTGPPR